MPRRFQRGFTGKGSGSGTRATEDLKGASSLVRYVSFLADDRFGASADESKSVIIWDIRTGFPVHRFFTEAFVTGIWQDPKSEIVWIGDFRVEELLIGIGK